MVNVLGWVVATSPVILRIYLPNKSDSVIITTKSES